MANQIAKDKQRVNLVIEKKLVAQIDAEAKLSGLTRTDVIVKAVREHMRLDPIPASAAQLAEMQTALVQLAADYSKIKNEIKADNDALLRAIRETAPALPSAEPGRKLSWRERFSGKLDG